MEISVLKKLESRQSARGEKDMAENLLDKLKVAKDTTPYQKKRAKYYDLGTVENMDVLLPAMWNADALACMETIDLVYRTLCGVLYNFAPTSGHPGGSISSGRIALALTFFTQDYDFSNPGAEDADRLIYAAGHKAMGLYAMLALRNELVRIAAPELLPDEKHQLRFEDLLGFRRNPTQETPLFAKFNAKPLDGHPSPLVPFVPFATGASGVGVPTALGFAFGAFDAYGDNAPLVHFLEGEGGMTAGRVHEALAAAASANQANVIMHIDWNQASIDSNQVCAADGKVGDYVQWSPAELCYTHDWNVIYVPDGKDIRQVVAAQRLALVMQNDQPTAIVYRTIKGWRYGIEGNKSHGAGHKYASEQYEQFVAAPFEGAFCDCAAKFPHCDQNNTNDEVEEVFFETLQCIRQSLEEEGKAASFGAAQVKDSQKRLQDKGRTLRSDVPVLQKIFDTPADPAKPEINLTPGEKTTLRGTLGTVLNILNKKTGGAFVGASADLFGSTSLSTIAKGFPAGFMNCVDNPGSRLMPVGGICEDAMGGFMTGLSTFGRHIGVTSSYGAFIAALEHVPARLHAIGQQARHLAYGDPMRTFIMINGHAGIKTGEDGPTHADPQCLQLLSENFPRGVAITLTPFEPTEIWPLVIAALGKRPALLAPFVTRPAETVPDRAALGLAGAEKAVQGIYKLVEVDPDKKPYHGTVVLQGSEVGISFVYEVLPVLRERGLNLNVYYVASAELFDLLPDEEKETIYPEARAREAMGITGFTLPTMYRWVTSAEGRKRTIHPFKAGRFLGSGKAEKVLEEGGLHPKALIDAISDYAAYMDDE